MRLVEILARELKEWPKPDTEYGPIESMSQADDLQVSHYAGVRQKWREDLGDWDGSVGDGYVPCSRFKLPELATDHATAIVTRAEWEAEKARIAGKVDGGWKRHRGGKCPVKPGTKVDYRMRTHHKPGGFSTANDGAELRWSHHMVPGDIMAYRIHKPAEQPAPASEPCTEVITATVESVSGPLEWRDRIYELDTQRAELEATYQRQIGEIDVEREGLVGQLRAEGLALVELVRQAVQWPEGAPSRDSAPEWATHIGRDTRGFHWFDHSPEEFDRECFLKGCLGDAGYRNGRWKEALKAPNSLPLWSCEI